VRAALCLLLLGCSSVDVTLGSRVRDAPRAPDGGSAGSPGSDAGTDPEPEDCAPEELRGAPFCDPETWNGTAPAADRDLMIAGGEVVLIDCAAEARTLTIEPGGALRASRERSSQLTLHGNLVVRGRLEYGRAGCRIPAEVSAEIVFTGMQDADYAGTPSSTETSIDTPVDTAMTALDSDVGLWVLEQGVFTAAGALKRAWSFLTDGAGPGDLAFAVEDATGWLPGDRVVLTPTAERAEPDHVEQFDERVIAAAAGARVELETDPQFAHAGCSDCLRRGEALNLTRNVVVRSADDGAHAHVMVADEALLQLDSVELRWLGPEWPEGGERCGGPARRAPLYFHQQDDAAQDSFVRHAAIWGGQSHFVEVERSHGVELSDIAGYDGFGSGFDLFYDPQGCEDCPRDFAPRGVLMREVLAARVGVALRAEGCVRIEHRHTGIAVSGGEGSGCVRCVATGVGYEGGGADLAGFTWQEGGSGRPVEFTFDDNVAHNNGNHGAFIWHNGGNVQPPYRNNAFWSNDGSGVSWGALANAFVLHDLVAADNGGSSLELRAAPDDARPRVERATLDDVSVLPPAVVPEQPLVLRELAFGGARAVAIAQAHDVCEGGDETDPADATCARSWLRIEQPTFAPGVVPFDFGWAKNRATVWEVRGFTHPDAEYSDLPEDFDLYRRDNEVQGGSLHAGFDAWLVPR
jgi:hypothetical protein